MAFRYDCCRLVQSGNVGHKNKQSGNETLKQKNGVLVGAMAYA